MKHKCVYCKTENFYFFDNGAMVMSNCQNNCLGTLRIYQCGEDEEIIKRYWNWKKNHLL